MSEKVQIERMASSAEAVAHLASGKTVFVYGGAPGDVAEIEVVEEKPTYARAKLIDLLEASPDREPSYRKASSDLAELALAPWAHLSYDAQLRAKKSNVENALKRVAHMPFDAIKAVVRDIVPSRHEWGYRNKLEFAARPDQKGRICIGVNAEGTHDFIELKEARLGNPLIRKSPKAIQGALRYLCGDEDLGIYRVGIRGSETTDSVELALWTPPSSFPRTFTARLLKDGAGATSVVRIIADPGSSRRVKQVEVLGGDGFWREEMRDRLDGKGGCETFDFRVSAPSFFQVNTPQAQNMVALVLQGLELAPGSRVADLYSGVGTFSFPLAAIGVNVTAVELEGSSSRDFKRNAELNQLDAEMICDDVARVLPRLGHLDAVVVDPPRAGLDKQVVSQLADCAPDKIAYVSCDVQTLSRDIERLSLRGYNLVSLTPVDMFPQTYHVECVSIFVRT